VIRSESFYSVHSDLSKFYLCRIKSSLGKVSHDLTSSVVASAAFSPQPYGFYVAANLCLGSFMSDHVPLLPCLEPPFPLYKLNLHLSQWLKSYCLPSFIMLVTSCALIHCFCVACLRYVFSHVFLSRWWLP
jgi:hypothetical protein